MTFALGMPDPVDNPACNVTMTKKQADLIRRAMAFYLDKTMALSDDEREEAEMLRDMAAEIDPAVLNGWCL